MNTPWTLRISIGHEFDPPHNHYKFMDVQELLRQEAIKQKMFTINTKIVCMNVDAANKELTYGKTYEIFTASRWPLLQVINDRGVYCEYGYHRFELAKSAPNTLARPMVRIGTNAVALHLSMHAEIVDIGSNYLWVRFTSEQFNKYSMKEREELIRAAYNRYAPRLAAQYEILIETYTPLDIMKIGELN